MTDHHELVSEMASVERMATQDRLKHARKRRQQQLKKFNQYEKQLDKDSKKKKSASHQNSVNKSINKRKKNFRVKFESSISLLESAARNDIEEVRVLLQNKTNPDVTNEDGLTALHQSCIDDNREMLKLLLDYGANVNAKDSELWTPLHAAATCGHVHLCQQLIERGAELLSVNADGNMPYDICEDEVTLDYIETEMSKRGITQEQIDETRLATELQMLEDLKVLGKDRKALERRLEGGVTALHIAAANGYLEVADHLIANRVAINMRDDDSWQPIHAAAYWGQPEILELLVQNGADIDAKTRNGETAFDLCEDPEMKQKILDMRDELETSRTRFRDPQKKHRTSTRSLTHSQLGGSSLYSSNSSLTEKTPSHSASIRRSSLRGDRSVLFKKEAKEEALHFGLRAMEDNDDDMDLDDDNKENLPATNIDDVTIIVPGDDLDKTDARDVAKVTQPPASAVSKPASQPQPARGRDSLQGPAAPVAVKSDAAKRPVADNRPPSQVDKPRAESVSSSGPPATGRVPPSQPQGIPPKTLSDVKQTRMQTRVVEPPTPRQKTVDDHVQDMFLSELSNPAMMPSSNPKASSVKVKTQNGHNNNNRNSVSTNRNPYPHQDEGLKSFKTQAVIGGDDEKQTQCCVIS